MTIQNLVDLAADEFFANHEEGIWQTHAIAIHDDGTHERFPIENGAKFLDFKDTFAEADRLAEGAGAPKHVAFHHMKDQGVEFVLISARDHNERAMAGFVIDDRTGDFLNDLTLIAGIASTSDFTLARPSDWEGEATIIEIDAAPMGYGHA